MPSKIEEFERINEPRVQRALDQIQLVEKSAASMRLPEAGAQLLQRVANYLTPHQQLPSAGSPVAQFQPVDGHDRAAIRAAYLKIAKGDSVHGLKDLRKVILGWQPEEKNG